MLAGYNNDVYEKIIYEDVWYLTINHFYNVLPHTTVVDFFR